MHFTQSILIAAISLFMISCGGDTPSGGGQSSLLPELRMEQATTTNSSIEVNFTLENADVAYCMLSDANSSTPVLSEVRKGQRLTESGVVLFENLEAGYTYKVYAVAGRNDIYGKITGIEVKTSGEIDYNFPAEGVTAITTTAAKTMLLKEAAIDDMSKVVDGAATLTLDPSTRYQQMEGFGPAITGSAAYNLSKMSAADRAKILRAAFHPTEGLGYSYIRISIGCSDFSLQEFTWCDYCCTLDSTSMDEDSS